MLDTNICIYGIKNRPDALRERFDQLAEALCISTITLGELLYGVEKSARRSQNLQAVEQFAARLEVLLFSAKAAAHFGQIRAELARVGWPCGAYDMLIAAHARSEGLTLVTNNVREFQRMPRLRIDNWVLEADEHGGGTGSEHRLTPARSRA
ncbi:MAG TPA: type II toxin-antitoxin system VapC family toxin [Stellaceae bacterium]|nr:type II toxin-antitoxin system VapC family toxin [Stellaceae bacterium]